MSLVVGGSHDGEDRPGEPLNQRTLVLPKQGRDGKDIAGQHELYQREAYGGPWIYRRDGVNDTGEPWHFERKE